MAVHIVTLELDVTEASCLSEKAHVAVTIHLPAAENLPLAPFICFGKPGGGYNRGYYTIDLPGPGKGAEAEWHANRGWIFVSVDHLGVGGSSIHQAGKLSFAVLAAANHAAEQQVLQRLAEGEVVPGYPKIQESIKIGIGQSMGGCLTVVQQARYHCYDGIGVLGFSGIHTHPPAAPGDRDRVWMWVARDGLPSQPFPILNQKRFLKDSKTPRAVISGAAMAWGFHYDDVDPDVVKEDLVRFDRGATDIDPLTATSAPPWGSLTFPIPAANTAVTPGTIATEAAAVACPVLVALGERDVIADPRGEPRAYLSSLSVDLFICPRMAHMHNFAGTREVLWRRLETWAAWVREVKSSIIANDLS